MSHQSLHYWLYLVHEVFKWGPGLYSHWYFTRTGRCAQSGGIARVFLSTILSGQSLGMSWAPPRLDRSHTKIGGDTMCSYNMIKEWDFGLIVLFFIYFFFRGEGGGGSREKLWLPSTPQATHHCFITSHHCQPFTQCVHAPKVWLSFI